MKRTSIACTICGQRTWVHGHRSINGDLCKTCMDRELKRNEHSDAGHAGTLEQCRECYPPYSKDGRLQRCYGCMKFSRRSLNTCPTCSGEPEGPKAGEVCGHCGETLIAPVFRDDCGNAFCSARHLYLDEAHKQRVAGAMDSGELPL